MGPAQQSLQVALAEVWTDEQLGTSVTAGLIHSTSGTFSSTAIRKPREVQLPGVCLHVTSWGQTGLSATRSVFSPPSINNLANTLSLRMKVMSP